MEFCQPLSRTFCPIHFVVSDDTLELVCLTGVEKVSGFEEEGLTLVEDLCGEGFLDFLEYFYALFVFLFHVVCFGV